jgi:stage II sporulation protein D
MRCRLVAALAGLLLLSGCNEQNREPAQTEVYAPSYATVPQSVPPIVYSQPVTVAAAAPDIRVAIVKNAPAVRVTAPAAGARIILAGSPWKQIAGGQSVNVTFTGNILALEGQPLGVASLEVESFSPTMSVRLNEHEAAPRVTISKLPTQNGLLAVGRLNLEEYLAGVLAGETPYERWHAEALKAQAVVSRTYALCEIRNRAGEAYDVDCTTASQVFRGGYRGIPQLTTAIDGTRGQVLTSDGAPFPTYFHSTCGGHTEAAAGIFPEHAGVKPLCGVNCPYCSASPAYRWKAALSKEQIGAKLRAQNGSIGKIESIAFADVRGGPIGTTADLRRVQTVTIKHSNGVTQLQGNAFRLQVGPKELKSLLFGQIAERGDQLEITGGGFGHGVGMCQYGAEGMAAQGEPFVRILGLYFPGAALTRVY